MISIEYHEGHTCPKQDPQRVDVERFTPSVRSGDATMEREPDGEWVRHSDYSALLQQVAELEVDRDAWKYGDDARCELLRNQREAAESKLAERDAEIATWRERSETNERLRCEMMTQFNMTAADLRDAERAREGAESKLAALLEIGPVLSECRWFLVDMHIWPVDTTIAVSVDLLPKVDDVIVKVHAALGHHVSSTAAAFLAANGGSRED